MPDGSTTPGLVAGIAGAAVPLAPPRPPPQYVQKLSPRSQSQQYVQRPQQYVQSQQYVQRPQSPRYVQPSQGMSGIRKGAIGYSLMVGLFPFPFNPLFLPFQMTIFIIMIIVLLFKGYGFWTAALLSWLIPGLIAAVIHYMFLSGLLSVVGYGEAASVAGV